MENNDTGLRELEEGKMITAIEKVLKAAKAEGRTALTEAESKAVLKAFGVPVVAEWVLATPEETVGKAAETGYPVVLKGLGSKLTHKTERGLVKLNLGDAASVRKAASEIKRGAGKDLEGYLLQPHLTGRREFVAGLFRDDQFGPVVMFGLGGVFTEALDDVVFRLAPLDEATARDMLDELNAGQLLGAFRGEEPADREALVKTLVGLSRIALEYPEVREIDINPLLVGPDGRVSAVDALVVLNGATADRRVFSPPCAPGDVEKIFNPRSIAFVGATNNIVKWGYIMIAATLAGGYEGQVYPVNSAGGEIAGRPMYKSLADIPGPVDLAIVTVPVDKVQPLLKDMEAKGIRSMILVTSGYGETGEEGKRLEQQLVEEARRAGILILGPNTMGICNPHAKFYCCGVHVRPRPGSMAFIAQSGNLGTQLLAFAQKEGIGIRAFSGSGNEAMITMEDYLDWFAVDELTRTVILYIESVRNGQRFFEAARRVGREKPVVVLKGGRTSEGNKAAASHTGALAGNNRVFNAACRQAGIVLVEQPMDLVDIPAAFSSLPLPRGKRVGIMTLGGGWGVVATDLCIEQGLEVPALSQEIIARIDQILPPYWSRSNPVDLVGEFDLTIPLKVMEEMMRWDGCDACIHMGIMGRRILVQWLTDSVVAFDSARDSAAVREGIGKFARYEDLYLEQMVRLMEKYGKPILGVYLLSDEKTETVTDIKGSPFRGVNYLTPERAVKVLAKMCAYERWLAREGVPVQQRGIRMPAGSP